MINWPKRPINKLFQKLEKFQLKFKMSSTSLAPPPPKKGFIIGLILLIVIIITIIIFLRRRKTVGSGGTTKCTPTLDPNIFIDGALSSWRSDKKEILDRFPAKAKRHDLGEKFLSQTIPSTVFKLYRKTSDAFEGYNFQVGYKFKDNNVSWEFYLSGKINFEHWYKCYKEVFPYGKDFSMPSLKEHEDIFCISMDINRDTYSNEYIDQLNVYLNSHGKPKYEYTLKPGGVFTFRGEAAYNIKSQGGNNFQQIADKAIEEGFDPIIANSLMKFANEYGWQGRSYGFLKKGNQVGLYISHPTRPTTQSYFEKLHPNISMANSEILFAKVLEIAIYFEGPPISESSKTIVRDAFYIGL
jgi:hypothetical protein